MGEFADFDLDRSTARAWRRFQSRLADHIADMQNDDVVVIMVDSSLEDVDEGSAPYIQFSAAGDDLVRGEVSSNEYLAPTYALDSVAVGQLTALGWGSPTVGRDEPAGSGSPNFFVDTERGSADRLAVMTVRALQNVFGVAHPAFLSAGTAQDDAQGPDIGIPARISDPSHPAGEPLAVEPGGVDHLRQLVDEALAPAFGHAPQHDSDGDIPVAAGSALVFVRVLEDTPVIELFSSLVRDVSELESAAEAVAELNNSTRLMKFLMIDDVVLAVIQLPAMPFVPQHLRSMLEYMSQVADDIDDTLVARLGGRRAFEDTTDDVEAAGDDGSGEPEDTELPPELQTLLHLDPDGVSGVEPDLAASVCNYDRDLVLQFLRISSLDEIAWRQSRDEAAMQGNAEEAAACEHEALGWAATVETLRAALRVIVERNRATG